MYYAEADGWGFPRKQKDFQKVPLDFHADGAFCTDARILRKNTDKFMIVCQKLDKTTQQPTIIIRVFDRKTLKVVSSLNKLVTENYFKVTSRLAISIIDQDNRERDNQVYFLVSNKHTTPLKVPSGTSESGCAGQPVNDYFMIFGYYPNKEQQLEFLTLFNFSNMNNSIEKITCIHDYFYSNGNLVVTAEVVMDSDKSQQNGVYICSNIIADPFRKLDVLACEYFSQFPRGQVLHQIDGTRYWINMALEKISDKIYLQGNILEPPVDPKVYKNYASWI